MEQKSLCFLKEFLFGFLKNSYFTIQNPEDQIYCWLTFTNTSHTCHYPRCAKTVWIISVHFWVKNGHHPKEMAGQFSPSHLEHLGILLAPSCLTVSFRTHLLLTVDSVNTSSSGKGCATEHSHGDRAIPEILGSHETLQSHMLLRFFGANVGGRVSKLLR